MKLTAAAARFYGEPHQIAAFNALELSLTAEQMEQFEETFQAGPPLPPCPPMEVILQRHWQTLATTETA